MDILIVDFETRSPVDLTTAGSHNYAVDPRTEIICACFKRTSTGRDWTWHPGLGALPPDLIYAIKDADLIGSWGPFDRLIWEYVAVNDHDFPALPTLKWYDLSAAASVNALPAGLDNCARALFNERKDFRGGSLIKRMSIPPYEHTPELLREMIEYCAKDVKLSYDIFHKIRLMTAQEHFDYYVSEIINTRGARVDVELATLAQAYAKDEMRELSARLKTLTHGVITAPTQTARFRKWMLARGDAELHNLMTVYTKGKKKFSLDRARRAIIQTAISDGTLQLPPETAAVIQAMDDGSNSSTAKFKRMAELADPHDHRVRGAFVYAGASQTLRFASRGLQLHNFKRDCFSVARASELKDEMQQRKPIPHVMATLASLLRPSLTPAPGHAFVVADWSSIEARVLPWLANEVSVLEPYERDEDVYALTASAMGYTDRQIGKVAVLSLGFGGGPNALASMARNFNLYLKPSAAQAIVDRWRVINSWAPRFWQSAFNAAKSALRNPGLEFPARRVVYQFIPALLDGTLICKLPGDLVLQYPYARLKEGELTSLKASYTMAADAKEWPRGTLWHGVLVENATQAFAARLLRHALQLFDEQGAPVVMHSHDEIVLEVPIKEADDWVVRARQIMSVPPRWAAGLPLKAEPYIVSRYSKG